MSELVEVDLFEEAKGLITTLVNVYMPEWHNGEDGGQKGYRCGYCKEFIPTLKAFDKIENHSLECEWAAAKAWLGEYAGVEKRYVQEES